MKKKTRLALNKETLRILSQPHLQKVAGARATDDCPFDTRSDCTVCYDCDARTQGCDTATTCEITGFFCTGGCPTFLC